MRPNFPPISKVVPLVLSRVLRALRAHPGFFDELGIQPRARVGSIKTAVWSCLVKVAAVNVELKSMVRSPPLRRFHLRYVCTFPPEKSQKRVLNLKMHLDRGIDRRFSSDLTFVFYPVIYWVWWHFVGFGRKVAGPCFVGSFEIG